MSEILFNRTLTPAELPNSAVTVDIPFPAGVITPWALVAVPIDGGANPAVDIVLDRLVGAVVESLVVSTALTDNEPNTFQRTDVVSRLRVTLTAGATPPDGGLRLQLIASRHSG